MWGVNTCTQSKAICCLIRNLNDGLRSQFNCVYIKTILTNLYWSTIWVISNCQGAWITGVRTPDLPTYSPRMKSPRAQCREASSSSPSNITLLWGSVKRNIFQGYFTRAKTWWGNEQQPIENLLYTAKVEELQNDVFSLLVLWVIPWELSC